MPDEHVLADSAGHTMIEIDALRAADLERILAAEPAEEDEEPTED